MSKILGIHSTIASTEWIAYTPAVEGFGTIIDYGFFYARRGDSILLRGKFQAGTVQSLEGKIPLPTGLTIADLTKMSQSTNIVGIWARNDNPGQAEDLFMQADPEADYIGFGALVSASGGLGGFLNGDAAIASGATLSFVAEVPVDGWNANDLVPVP